MGGKTTMNAFIDDKNDELLTFDEFCEELHIGTGLGYRLLKSGQVKAFHLGRAWRIPRSSIQKMIRENISDKEKSNLKAHLE